MTGTDGARYPFWSADSRSIGYFASRKLYRIDVGGGPPQELADVPVARGGTWNADGTIVFAPTDDGPLMRIAAPGTSQVRSPISIRDRRATDRRSSCPMAATFSSLQMAPCQRQESISDHWMAVPPND